jgi:hypothetical protein
MSATTTAANGKTFPFAAAGGITVEVQAAPAVTAAAYSSGQCIGGLITLNGALRADGPGSGLLQSVAAIFNSAQSAEVDVVLFSANPSASTFNDHATASLAAADAAKVIFAGAMTLPISIGTPVLYQALNIAKDIVAAAGATMLYAALIARGALTPTATTDLTVTFGFLQD